MFELMEKIQRGEKNWGFIFIFFTSNLQPKTTKRATGKILKNLEIPAE